MLRLYKNTTEQICYKMKILINIEYSSINHLCQEKDSLLLILGYLKLHRIKCIIDYVIDSTILQLPNS